MKNKLLIAAVAVFPLVASAQDFPFGKPSLNELALRRYEPSNEICCHVPNLVPRCLGLCQLSNI